MVNKALRIVLYSIFTISLLFVVPFNTIHADDYTGSTIVGFNTLYDGVSEVDSLSKYSYREHFVLDDSYVGYINITLTVKYYNYQGQLSQTVLGGNNYFVNGNFIDVPFFITGATQASGDRPSINNVTVEYGNHNLVKHSALNDLDQIISLLTDLYNNTDGIEGLESSQLTALQNIVSNTSLANTYLETISKMRQWHYPIESFTFNYYLLSRYEPKSIINISYYDYPVFNLKYGDYLYSAYLSNTNKYIYLIFGIDKNVYLGALPQYFDYTGLSVYYYDSLYLSGISEYRIVKMILEISDTSVNNFNIMVKQNINVVPILAIRDYEYKNNYFSTDFALQFGLSNRLLDNLDKIANGTTESSSAAQSSDNANSQLQQDSNTLFTQEDSFKQNMNSAMQNIDTTFTLNNFGSSFMTSAQWVRTQYETLTNNTPFASLITFSLLVGLALIVIGKVYK